MGLRDRKAGGLTSRCSRRAARTLVTEAVAWGAPLAAERIVVRRIGGSRHVFRAGGFRFYFFSREEPRIHVHAQSADGEAKFWLDPAVELAVSYNLKEKDLTKVRKLIEDHKDEIRAAWNKHFKR